MTYRRGDPQGGAPPPPRDEIPGPIAKYSASPDDGRREQTQAATACSWQGCCTVQSGE